MIDSCFLPMNPCDISLRNIILQCQENRIMPVQNRV